MERALPFFRLPESSPIMPDVPIAQIIQKLGEGFSNGTQIKAIKAIKAITAIGDYNFKSGEHPSIEFGP